ncbi:hypothetical protein D3C80_1737110 [compost metagenome]
MAHRLGLHGVAGPLRVIQASDQIVVAEETQQLLDLFLSQRQAGFGIGGLQHPLRIAQRPMTQQAHGGGAELEVPSAQWVGQCPLGRTVERWRGR